MTPGIGSDVAVSVVIPCCDSSATVVAAVRSALEQSAPPLEVIVVDDGSMDGSASLVAQAFGERVRLISQNRRGPSAARNAGMSAARGTWTAFLDADDEWHVDKLRMQLDVLARHHGCVLVASDWTRGDLGTGLPARARERTISWDDLVVLNRFQTSTVVLSSDVAKATGGFDASLDGSEDWDLWVRVAARGEIVKLEAPLVRYADSPGGVSKDLGRVYATAMVVARREIAGLPRRRRHTLLAWHHLRFAVAAHLAGDRELRRRCLVGLRSRDAVAGAPVAAARYLVPFLARRVLGRRVLGRRVLGLRVLGRARRR
ncbi:MAG: glycosyltransferase family 2 protein [Acidimicrobiales bacterium]